MKTFFRCQGCSRKLGVDDSQAGRVGNCPSCDFVFVVPEKSDPEFALRRSRADSSAIRDDRREERFPRRKKERTVEDEDVVEDLEELDEEDDDPVPKVKKRKKRRRKVAASGDPNVFLPLFLLTTALLSAGFALSIPFPVVAQAVFWAAWLVGMASGIWLYVVAYQEDPICLLLNLFVPFYSLYYLVTRWSNTWRPFLLSTVGAVFMVLAFFRMISIGVGQLKADFKGMHEKGRQHENLIIIGTPPGKQPWMANPADTRRPGR